MKINSALIIEDEMDTCLLFKNYLSKKSDTVSFSVTLNDGILKLKKLKPDLLILDHNLPDGHGIENIRQFKKGNSSLFVIVISAMWNLKNSALENAADFFMEKPLSFRKLNELLA